MTEASTIPVASTEPHKGLLGRAIGVILAPRATYADLVGLPRVLGALLVCLLVLGGTTVAFLNTEVGRQAVLDQQAQQAEAFGRPMTDAQYEQMERIAPYLGYIGAAFQVVTIVVGSLILTLLAMAVFNAFLGHDATFKQAWAVVVHSGFVLILAPLFVFPLNYVRETMTSPTTLSVFMPFLEENSFLAHMFGAIDLFYIWWLVNLAIGFGVLYKRRTGPIATVLLCVYVALAVVVAGVRQMLSGA